MTKLDPATQYYVEITLELPNGQRDLYHLTQTLKQLNLETWNETYKRRQFRHCTSGYPGCLVLD